MAPPRVFLSTALRTTPRRKRQKRAYDVHTNREPHSKRLDVRLTPTERESLDLLVQRWDATSSQIVRSLIIGATLGELDRLDAIEAAEPSFDALVEVPSIDDVLAGS
jgi:hypothetical protein